MDKNGSFAFDKLTTKRVVNKRYYQFYKSLDGRCEHPVIIPNPILGSLDFLRERWQFFFFDKCYSYEDMKKYHLLSVSKLPHDKDGYVHAHLDSYYAISHDTFEVIPLFIHVPCRHCSICLKSKQNGIIQRCTFESFQHKLPPLFVTLTYNPNNCPLELQVPDAQKFKKRLKTNISRYFSPDVAKNIRFAMFGEYGHETGRPHYHALIYGFPFNEINILLGKPKPYNDEFLYKLYATAFISWCWRNDNNEKLSFVDYFKDFEETYYYNLRHRKEPNFVYRYPSSSKGFVNLKISENASNISKYVSKYISKGVNGTISDVPYFRPLLSQHLGLEFAKAQKENALRSPDGTFKVLVGNKVTNMRFCAYYFQRVFENINNVIPAPFRRCLDNLYFWCNLYLHKYDPLTFEYNRILKDINNLMEIPFYPPPIFRRSDFTERELKTPIKDIIYNISLCVKNLEAYKYLGDTLEDFDPSERYRYMYTAYLTQNSVSSAIRVSQIRKELSNYKFKL